RAPPRPGGGCGRTGSGLAPNSPATRRNRPAAPRDEHTWRGPLDQGPGMDADRGDCIDPGDRRLPVGTRRAGPRVDRDGGWGTLARDFSRQTGQRPYPLSDSLHVAVPSETLPMAPSATLLRVLSLAVVTATVGCASTRPRSSGP